MRFPQLLAILAFAFPLLGQLPVSPPAPLTAPVYGSASGAQTEPAIASNGTAYLVAWTDFRAMSATGNTEVFATRVAADGTILDPAGIALPATFVADEKPAVVWNGFAYVVVIATPRFGFGLNAVEVGPDGKVGEPHQLVAGEVNQPSIAWNGAAYLVAWSEETGLGSVKAQLFDRAFHPISEPVTLGTPGSAPSVATNSSGFLVSWSDRTNFRIRYATLSATGALAAGPFELGESAERTTAAFNRSDYAIAWNKNTVRVSRVATNGTLVRTVDLPVAFEENAGPAGISWDGTRWVVAWTESRHIAAAELDASLNVTRAPRIVVSQPQPFVRSAAVVSAFDRSLVVWSDATAFDQETDIRGALITGATLQSTFLVSRGDARQFPQDVAAMPSGLYGAVWLENNDRLMFGRLDAAGRPLDGGGIALAEGVTEARIAASNDHFAVVYTINTQAFVARITRDGQRVGSQPLNAAKRTALPVIASDGSGFAIAWGEGDSRILETMVARMNAGGVLSSITRISPAGTIEESYDPLAIAWSGVQYVVAVGARHDLVCGSRICGTSVNASLYFLDSANQSSRAPVTFASTGTIPVAKIVSGGNVLGVLWLSGGNVFFRRFLLAGDPLGDLTIVRSKLTAIDADLVWTGQRFVAISDEREGELLAAGRVYVTPLDVPSEAQSFASARGQYRQGLAAAPSPNGGALLVHTQTIARNPEAHPEGIARAFVRFIDRVRARVTRR